MHTHAHAVRARLLRALAVLPGWLVLRDCENALVVAKRVRLAMTTIAQWNLHRFNYSRDKGKPAVRQRRKASGLMGFQIAGLPVGTLHGGTAFRIVKRDQRRPSNVGAFSIRGG
jgi:hypothetical protein